MAEPKLRFKKDDGTEYVDWKVTTFDKEGTFTKGAALSKADISEEGTPFILYGELYTTYGEVANKIERKTEAEVESKYYSKVGDVIIPTSGETREDIATATCVMVPGVILAGDLNIYRSNDIDGRIISYITKHSVNKKISQIAQGKSVVHISADKIKPIEFSCPNDKEEQKKIAEFLSSVDELIATSEEEVANLEQQKKAAMQAIFSQQVRFKKEDGSDFPEWEEKKIGDIGEPKMCKRVLKEQTASEGEIPFYKIGTFDRCADAYISRELFEELKSKYSYPQKGNILLSASGTIGRTVVFDGEDAYFQDSNIVWIQHDESITDEFLLHFFKHTTWKNLEGGTIDRLYNGILMDKDISVPEKAEQKLIADFLTSFDEAIAAAREELEKYKELKKGLLQQMFV